MLSYQREAYTAATGRASTDSCRSRLEEEPGRRCCGGSVDAECLRADDSFRPSGSSPQPVMNS